MSHSASRRRLALIVNPVSGRGKVARNLPALVRDIEALGLEVTSTDLTKSLDHATDLARAAVAKDCVAVAVGGDGLVSAVAGAIAETSTGVVGIVPSGRGNDFARMLGIKERFRALDALRGVEKPVDLGWVNGRYFTCIASVGIDSKVMEAAERIRILSGSLVYPYATVKALTRWRPARFDVTADDVRRTFEGYSVAIANGGFYGSGMWLAPQADVTDELVDVVTIARVSRLRFLQQGLGVYKGKHVTHPAVDTCRARQVTINADQPFIVFADGEPVSRLPVTVEAKLNALRVLLPAD